MKVASAVAVWSVGILVLELFVKRELGECDARPARVQNNSHSSR